MSLRHRRAWLIALTACVAAAQLWIAHHFYGFLTGDEVEVLSEAFRVATGAPYGLWNVRCRFVPHVFAAPPVALGARLGIHDPATLIWLATLPFVAASALTIPLVYALAKRLSNDELAARAAALLFALHWIPLGFGGTTYPRVVAMACLTAAALLVRRETNLACVAAGLLAGIAFADRFSEIVFVIPLAIAARRRAAYVVAGFVASASLTVGVYDWLTWGAPFASLRNFARVTLVVRDFSSRVKVQSPLWYLETLPRWCALTLVPFFWRARRREVWLYVLIPLVALSCIPHKELRYLQSLVPFLAVVAGFGFASLLRTHPRVAVALLALSLTWNLVGLRFVERRSMPAVAAARFLGRDTALHTLAIPQLWAFGDKLYLGQDRRVFDIGSPPHDLAAALDASDAVAIYGSDLTPAIRTGLAQRGYVLRAVFRRARARDVVVFVRSPSGTSDRARR
jgi:GPI mannosyltransferase 3